MSDNIFHDIYQNNRWQSDESVSGHGSTMVQTAGIRKKLPELFKELRIKNILDIPCGDFNWWKEMPLPGLYYVGADVVPELIDKNRELYGDHEHEFRLADIRHDLMQGFDMIFVRDLLGHFGEGDLGLALATIRMSRPKYLLATTFPDSKNNFTISTGQWRALNLEYHCGLPPAMRVINEGNPKYEDKSLGLWRLW